MAAFPRSSQTLYVGSSDRAVDLARYLFQSGHFSARNARVKPAGFNPGRRGELSVADVEGLSDPDRWEIGATVAELQGRPVKARADFSDSVLTDLPLSFLRDDDPFDRHGNITGWPTGKDDEARLRRKELAVVLAAGSTLELPP